MGELPNLCCGQQQQTPAQIAPRNQNRDACSPSPGNGASWGASSLSYLKRLSATDISALASMKNVAKCDTWCEMQNPVNHRVFERKLRPKSSGRGHACLGVTKTSPNPLHPPFSMGTMRAGGYWPPASSCDRGWPKRESPVRWPRHAVVGSRRSLNPVVVPRRLGVKDPDA